MEIHCREVLAFAPSLFQADAWRGPDTVVQLNLEGAKGGDFYIEISGGRLRVHEGRAAAADVTVATTDELFAGMMLNMVNPMTAYMKRKVRVQGNVKIVMKLLSPKVLPREVRFDILPVLERAASAAKEDGGTGDTERAHRGEATPQLDEARAAHRTGQKIKAIQFDENIPRYVVSKFVGSVFPSFLYSRFSCIHYTDVAVPRLPGDDWVLIRTKLAGVCGSDLVLIRLKDSPSTTPFVRFPFTIGHENLGVIVEKGRNVEEFAVGDRVVVDPTLSCPTRSITPACPQCQAGNFSTCTRFTDGALQPATGIGTSMETGGGWSPYFVAHRHQLFAVPEGVKDEDAVLVDPFCSCLHAVLRNRPADSDTVLVLGGGTIGLGVAAALRALDLRCRIILVAKYPFQANLARKLGADDVLLRSATRDIYETVAQQTGGRAFKPVVGAKMKLGGGADVVYDTIGSISTINEGLRLARAGGKLVLIGIQVPWSDFLHVYASQIDLTPLWLFELRVSGTYACSTDVYRGRRARTYAAALDLLERGKVSLAPLLTHRFPLAEYRRAIWTGFHRGKTGAVKIAFTFD